MGEEEKVNARHPEAEYDHRRRQKHPHLHPLMEPRSVMQALDEV
jgi:hypothetical protein